MGSSLPGCYLGGRLVYILYYPYNEYPFHKAL